MICKKCGEEIIVHMVELMQFDYPCETDGQVVWAQSLEETLLDSMMVGEAPWCSCSCGEREDCPYYYNGVADKVLLKE